MEHKMITKKFITKHQRMLLVQKMMKDHKWSYSWIAHVLYLTKGPETIIIRPKSKDKEVLLISDEATAELINEILEI